MTQELRDVVAIEALALAIATSFVAVLIHYESLRLISAVSNRAPLTPRPKMLTVIFGMVGAHMT